MFCSVFMYSRLYEQHLATLSWEVNCIILKFLGCPGPLSPLIHNSSRGFEWLQISQKYGRVMPELKSLQCAKKSAKVNLSCMEYTKVATRSLMQFPTSLVPDYAGKSTSSNNCLCVIYISGKYV
jgi:hypothetical protein